MAVADSNCLPESGRLQFRSGRQAMSWERDVDEPRRREVSAQRMGGPDALGRAAVIAAGASNALIPT
jgi:hypothetical protein